MRIKFLQLPAVGLACSHDKTQARQAKKPTRYVWNFAKDMEGKTFKKIKKGEEILSEKFTLLDVPDMQLSLCPRGVSGAARGQMSVFLYAPQGWQIRKKVTLGDVVMEDTELNTHEDGFGWRDFASWSRAGSTELAVELLEAVPSTSNAA